MAYGFNEDRSKAPVYTKTEVDAMDLANDQALTQEALDRQAGDAALESQLDTIIANPLTEEATIEEVVNIRNGYNGTVYPSAGDAVREQVQDIFDKNRLMTKWLNSSLFDIDTLIDETNIVKNSFNTTVGNRDIFTAFNIEVAKGDVIWCLFVLEDNASSVGVTYSQVRPRLNVYDSDNQMLAQLAFTKDEQTGFWYREITQDDADHIFVGLQYVSISAASSVVMTSKYCIKVWNGDPEFLGVIKELENILSNDIFNKQLYITPIDNVIDVHKQETKTHTISADQSNFDIFNLGYHVATDEDKFYIDLDITDNMPVGVEYDFNARFNELDESDNILHRRYARKNSDGIWEINITDSDTAKIWIGLQYSNFDYSGSTFTLSVTASWVLYKNEFKTKAVNDKTLGLIDDEHLYATELYNSAISMITSSSNSMVARDASFYADKVPSYYISKPDPQNYVSFDDDSYLENVIHDIPDNGKKLLFFTDSHWPSNRKHTVPLLAYVKARTGAHKVVWGGDFLNVQQTKYEAYGYMCDFADQCIRAFGPDFTPVMGNHDLNVTNFDKPWIPWWDPDTMTYWDLLLPFSQTRKVLFGALENETTWNVDDRLAEMTSDPTTLNELKEYMKMTYFIDDPIDKIRYIILNSGNPQYGYVYNTFGVGGVNELYITLEFLAQALSSTPEGFDVVVCCHQVITYNYNTSEKTFYTANNVVMSILRAAKKKESIEVTISSQGNLRTWIGASTYTADFSNISDIGKVIVLCGHDHKDGLFVYDESGIDFYNESDTVDCSNGEIPVILTALDAQGLAQNPGEPTMTANTVTEQTFDCITIENNKITATRFGAGNFVNVTHNRVVSVS